MTVCFHGLSYLAATMRIAFTGSMLGKIAQNMDDLWPGPHACATGLHLTVMSQVAIYCPLLTTLKGWEDSYFGNGQQHADIETYFTQ